MATHHCQMSRQGVLIIYPCFHQYECWLGFSGMFVPFNILVQEFGLRTPGTFTLDLFAEKSFFICYINTKTYSVTFKAWIGKDYVRHLLIHHHCKVVSTPSFVYKGLSPQVLVSDLQPPLSSCHHQGFAEHLKAPCSHISSKT